MAVFTHNQAYLLGGKFSLTKFTRKAVGVLEKPVSATASIFDSISKIVKPPKNGQVPDVVPSAAPAPSLLDRLKTPTGMAVAAALTVGTILVVRRKKGARA